MAERYCFGRFTLDPVQRTLCADGVPVSLGPTDFRLLLALAGSGGAIVTKGDLLSLVGGRTVRDNVLHVHISALRKALGNDCIVNQQGRGYRLATPVQRIEASHAHGKSRVGNLPLPWASDATMVSPRLIGRSEQLRVISEMLAHGRMVTLTGPGGVGKTRLALQAADDVSGHFCDGVWLVELASCNNADLVPSTIASSLGVKIGANATPLDTLSRYLEQKSLLVVLDNCEHVIAACARISETLLGAAPGLKILATSREALSCSSEQGLDLPALTLPRKGATAPNELRNTAAIALFIERAKRADASFDIDDNELTIVARICHRVDGLPLAIEMVAGWAGVLGLETLDAKLDGSLKDWLHGSSTAPARHATLGATLEWSHGLLSAAEQTVLRRLAVFAGSFNMEAAEAVTSGGGVPRERVFEHVASLIRKSMVVVVPGSRAQRYRLLETTRAFMMGKLTDSCDANATRRRHARYVLRVIEIALREWETTSDAALLERCGPLLDDLRAALDWAMDEDSDHAVALAGASWPLWHELSLRTEGRQRLSPAASRLRPGTPLALEARLRRGLGDMLLNATAIKPARDEFERAVILYRTLGDAVQLGSALSALGWSLLLLGRTEEANHAIREALSLLPPTGSPRTLATTYATQSCIETILGHFQEARIAADKAALLCEMVGGDRAAFVVASNLVQLCLERGDVDVAVSTGRDMAVRLRNTCHSDLLGFVLGVVTSGLTALGDLKEALATAREAAPLLRDDGTLYWLFDHLALRAGLAGRGKDSALISGYADAVYQKSDRSREPMGCRAMERTTLLLRDMLSEEEIAQFRDLGAQLSEDQATTIALSA